MTFRITFIFIMTVVAAAAYAQEPAKQSSYGKIKQESSGTALNDLLDEANALKDSAPKKALELVKEALAISLIRQDAVAESRCYNLLGEINMNIEEWKLAQDNFLAAYDNLPKKRSPGSQEKITALSGLGRANLKLGNFQRALRYLNELRNLKAGSEVQVNADIDISEVHYQTGNYDEALNAINRAVAFTKVFDPATQARLENQKARIYARTNQVEESYKSFQSGQDILRSNTARSEPKAQEQQVRSAKDEISDVLQEQKRYDEKIALLNSSIDYNMDVNNYGEVARDKVELSNTFLAKGETSAALRQLEEAAVIADTIADPKEQAVAFLSLAELYHENGQSRAALNTYRKYSEAVLKNEREAEQKLTEKSELISTQRDIEALSKYIAISKQEEQLAQAMVFRQKLVIYGLVFVILIIAVTSYFIYKNALASKTANQLLALKSLRSQMNPHFIFNALNSVNQFVSQQDERAANRFLSEFSRLMRLVLEHSQEDFIALYKEEEIISLYLKLEHYRFRDKFDYEIIVDESINKEAVEIPPMLIQPYIENAIWHGLRYRESKGFLSVQIKQTEATIVVTISDNGIGRRRSAELKTDNQMKHQSTGIKNIRERLGIINKVYKCHYEISIEDKPGDAGTTVNLYVPLTYKTPANA